MPQLDLSFLARPALLWWAGLLLALLAGTYSYYRLAAPLGAGVRNVLRAARLLALLTLLLALLEPMLTVRSEGSGRSRLAVLVDRSSSMSLPGADAETRSEECSAILATLEEALSGRFDLDVQGFAGGVEARRNKEPVYPWEPLGVTAIGNALEELLIRQAESPVGGVLLMTDGVHTAGKDPGLVAPNLSVPVFTVVLGDTISPPDLLLRQVRTQAVGCVGEPVAVHAVLENWGFEGREAVVTVRERCLEGATPWQAGRVLAERHMELPAVVGRELEAALEIEPSHIGLTLFEISASIDTGEAVTVNNSRLFAVDVREKKTRLLYIECEPDWDFAFLKRTLDADTSLSYTYLVRQKNGETIRYGAPGPGRMPRTAVELAPYAAVILGRTAPDLLHPETVEALKHFLLDGGGVLFLGAAGGGDLDRWRSSWRDLLPVSVRVDRRSGHTASLAGITLHGLAHEITAADESPVAVERRWQALPPIWIPEGHYSTAAGAAVLLTAQTAHPPREVPLLALAHAGAGRVAVITGRGFWRWDFVMGSVIDEPPLVRELWRRMTRWLSEPSQRERFKVRPIRHVFQDSEALAFVGRLYDDAFQPVSGARIAMTIEPMALLEGLGEDETSGPGSVNREGGEAGSGGPEDSGQHAWPARGTRRAPEAVQIYLYPDGPPGRYAAAAAPLPPGMYRYRADVARERDAARGRQTSEGIFWVERMGPEFFDLAGSRRIPDLLAESSGGIVVAPGEESNLISCLPDRCKRVRVVQQAEMWNHWALFAFLMIMLSVEWVLRRRKGLA